MIKRGDYEAAQTILDHYRSENQNQLARRAALSADATKGLLVKVAHAWEKFAYAQPFTEDARQKTAYEKKMFQLSGRIKDLALQAEELSSAYSGLRWKHFAVLDDKIGPAPDISTPEGTLRDVISIVRTNMRRTRDPYVQFEIDSNLLQGRFVINPRYRELPGTKDDSHLSDAAREWQKKVAVERDLEHRRAAGRALRETYQEPGTFLMLGTRELGPFPEEAEKFGIPRGTHRYAVHIVTIPASERGRGLADQAVPSSRLLWRDGGRWVIDSVSYCGVK